MRATPGMTGDLSTSPRSRPTAIDATSIIKQPAINVAIGDYTKDDLDGQPRNKPHIGADEFSSSVVNRRPLTQRGVGPSWMKNRATLIQ